LAGFVIVIFGGWEEHKPVVEPLEASGPVSCNRELDSTDNPGEASLPGQSTLCRVGIANFGIPDDTAELAHIPHARCA
jgi:hypothetical protein